MNLTAYLNRINYRGPLTPTVETLRALHRQHMLAVPFENLDIHLGRPILLDEARLFDKIVRQRRGGFCYELNGLFAALLRELGFEVTLLAAGMFENGEFGPDFGHLTLLVRLEETWLADVSYSFVEPLRLAGPGEQIQQGRVYRLTGHNDGWMLREQGQDGGWQPAFRFKLQPYRLSDFDQMCHYTQTSPRSSFTQRYLCYRTTPTGRITLSNMRLIITANGRRRERELAGQAEYVAMLQKYFEIELPATGSFRMPAVQNGQ